MRLSTDQTHNMDTRWPAFHLHNTAGQSDNKVQRLQASVESQEREKEGVLCDKA